MRALDEIDALYEHCEKYEDFDSAGSTDHTSLLVNKMHYETTQTASTEEGNIYSQFLSLIENDNRLDPIRNNPRFIDKIDLMRTRSDTKD